MRRSVSPSIRMGEMAVANDQGELRTLLGSCIGLALYDRRRRLGGLAHIVLPDSRGRTDRPGKFADTAIPALIAQLGQIAAGPHQLRAKVAGGASMFSTQSAQGIGKQNIDSCHRLLEHLGIPISASHCGGNQGRRMCLDISTGRVTIEIVGCDPIEL